MNPYITGSVIKELREERRLTQAELAEQLCVSDKTVSKWETGKGYPDISLLEPIARVFGVSVIELLSGNAVSNKNVAASMFRSTFYICPVCGNVIHSMGEAVLSCHGITLTPAEAEECDGKHSVSIEQIDGEYYVRVEHDMTKNHYISFIAAVSPDRVQLVKLYPEGNAETRFMMNGVRKLYIYCNRDGLFRVSLPGRRKNNVAV